MKKALNAIASHWERVFFFMVGIGLIIQALYLIYEGQIAGASAVFGLGFLSFIYANVARFKKFKGLGFEAELWEDTKKEAEGLIERLRNVVAIYSREAILRRVMEGRFGDGGKWAASWKLYDDLIAEHDALGQKIDLSDVKVQMDNVFLGDLTFTPYVKIHEAIQAARERVEARWRQEFGTVIHDNEAHRRHFEPLKQIPVDLPDLYEFAKIGNCAQFVLQYWHNAKSVLKTHYDIDINVDQTELDCLNQLSAVFERRPVIVTAELIEWANRSPYED